MLKGIGHFGRGFRLQRTDPNLALYLTKSRGEKVTQMSTFKTICIFNLQSGRFSRNKFSIKNFFRKCDPIRNFLWIWPHLLKKSLMENFIFCAIGVIQIISYRVIGDIFF